MLRKLKADPALSARVETRRQRNPQRQTNWQKPKVKSVLKEKNDDTDEPMWHTGDDDGSNGADDDINGRGRDPRDEDAGESGSEADYPSGGDENALIKRFSTSAGGGAGGIPDVDGASSVDDDDV